MHGVALLWTRNTNFLNQVKGFYQELCMLKQFSVLLVRVMLELCFN